MACSSSCFQLSAGWRSRAAPRAERSFGEQLAERARLLGGPGDQDAFAEKRIVVKPADGLSKLHYLADDDNRGRCQSGLSVTRLTMLLKVPTTVCCRGLVPL